MQAQSGPALRPPRAPHPPFPGNVFITKRMQVKIGDLGLARREEQPCRRRG